MIKKRHKNGQHPPEAKKDSSLEEKTKNGCFRKFDSVKALLEGLKK